MLWPSAHTCLPMQPTTQTLGDGGCQAPTGVGGGGCPGGPSCPRGAALLHQLCMTRKRLQQQLAAKCNAQRTACLFTYSCTHGHTTCTRRTPPTLKWPQSTAFDVCPLPVKHIPSMAPIPPGCRAAPACAHMRSSRRSGPPSTRSATQPTPAAAAMPPRAAKRSVARTAPT